MKNFTKLIYIVIGISIINIYILNHNPQIENNCFYIIDKSQSEPDTSYLIPLPFVVGVSAGPYEIDPINAYDTASFNVINQVCEGLFRNNLSDQNLPRVNHLAESYWWENTTTLQLKLREGILFHDNTLFNATAAKWNLDRINYFTNSTGMLTPPTEVADASALWKFPNGTGIMKQIDVVDDYNITIHLNAPFSPFLDLLCYPGASIISPSSHSQINHIL